MRPNEIGDGSLEREREVPENGRWNPILNKSRRWGRRWSG